MENKWAEKVLLVMTAALCVYIIWLVVYAIIKTS